MAFARSGSKVQSKINATVYGAQFCGKSTYGVSLAKLKRPDGKPFRVLVCDAEMGSVDEILNTFEEEGINLDNIYIVYSQSLEEISYYIDLAANHKDIYQLDSDGNETSELVLDADGEPFHPDALLIDGSTIIKMACQQSLLNLSRKRARVRAKNNGLVGEEKQVAIDSASLEMKDWGNLAYSGQSLVLNLAASGLHWILTCREKEVTQNKMVNGTIQIIHTGQYEPDSFKGVAYNSKTIMRFFRDPENPDVVKMIVEKDRTGTYAPGQIVENPSILDFQPLIDKQIGRNFTPKNTMEQAIEIESKMYQRQNGMSDEEISDTSSANDSVQQDAATDPVEIKKEIKKNHSTMNPAQRSEFSAALKKNDLPTAISKVEDANILNRILEISREVLE